MVETVWGFIWHYVGYLSTFMILIGGYKAIQVYFKTQKQLKQQSGPEQEPQDLLNLECQHQHVVPASHSTGMQAAKCTECGEIIRDNIQFKIKEVTNDSA